LIEVYTGSVGTIELITYKDGVPVAPDSTPSVVVTNAETGASVASGNATILNPDYCGEYYYNLPSSATSTDRVLKVVWSYSISGRSIQETEYVYVVTPYATVDEIVAELGYSSRPEDPNYFSYEKIRTAERAARMMISNELGFTMGKRTGSTTAYGSGADVLVLSEKILSISELYENDELMVDVSENYNIFGFNVEITETGYGIRIVPPNPGDDIDERESIDFIGYEKGRFRDGYRYKINGVLGWNYIPAEIKQCVFLLVNDLLCNDSIWRSRYVKKINSGQMSVELSSLTFNGTGNAIVDAILQKFKMIQAVII
jgi:hypothetical protein